MLQVQQEQQVLRMELSKRATQERTYTQSELEQAVKSAVSKETAKFADFEKCKAAYDEAQAKADADKSELQKALERAEAAEAERDALQLRKSKLRGSLRYQKLLAYQKLPCTASRKKR